QEEICQALELLFCKDGETRQWLAITAIKRRWNAPYTAAPISALGQMLWLIFDQPVGRISNAGVKTVGRTFGQPFHTICVNQFVRHSQIISQSPLYCSFA
ncbi:MAG: hypothetical protein AAB658_00910, partial [Chloroflexota bacterium]